MLTCASTAVALVTSAPLLLVASASQPGEIISTARIANGVGGLPSDFAVGIDGGFFAQQVSAIGDVDGDGIEDMAIQTLGTRLRWAVIYMKTDGTAKGYKDYWLNSDGNLLGLLPIDKVNLAFGVNRFD